MNSWVSIGKILLANDKITFAKVNSNLQLG